MENLRGAGVHAHSASVSQELGAQGQWPPLDSTGLAGLLLCELLSLARRLSETAGPAAQEVSPRRGKCGSTESRDEAAWGRRGCSSPAQPPAALELHRNTHVRPLTGNYSPSSWMLTLDLALGVSPRIGGKCSLPAQPWPHPTRQWSEDKEGSNCRQQQRREPGRWVLLITARVSGNHPRDRGAHASLLRPPGPCSVDRLPSDTHTTPTQSSAPSRL
ncbi:uncharacterized protein [Equus asinus]|uniref:uncharacterized protein n=1 Tax=Equus asinus TaxID=9793 RepID=UPI0038F67AF1